MAGTWTATADKATNDVITSTIWNNYFGASGDLQYLYENADPVGGFRTPRKLLGLFAATNWTGADGGAIAIREVVGTGFTHSPSSLASTSTGVITNALLEAYTVMTTGGALTDAIGCLTTAAVVVANTAPNKNPTMLIRWFPGASNANLTTSIAGFQAAGTVSATSAGAYLRANTTGNLFFVTRQGGSETTTDLGARPTTPTSYEISTADSGVTWTCRNTTTGVVVATHTTNVPTATVGLGHAIGGVSSSGALNVANVVFCRVDSNSVA